MREINLPIHWSMIQKQMKLDHSDSVIYYFNYFLSPTVTYLNYQQIHQIFEVTDYLEKKNEIASCIKWYMLVIDHPSDGAVDKQMEIRRRMAKIYSFAGYKKKAVELYHKNIVLLEKSKQFDELVYEHGSLATMWLLVKETKRAEANYLKSLKYALMSQNAFNINYAYNNLGFFYTENHQLNQAKSYYEKGIEFIHKNASKDKYKIQLILMKGNLGSVYLQLAHSAEDTNAVKGFQLLHSDFSYNLLEGANQTLGANAGIEIAKFYIKFKQYTQSIAILKSILPIIGKENHTLLTRVYEHLFISHLSMGNIKEANVFFQQYDVLRRTLDSENELKRVEIEKALITSILETQIQLKTLEASSQASINRYLSILLIIGLISAVLIASFIFAYWKKRTRLARSEKDIAEKQLIITRQNEERTRLELQYKNQDLTDFGIDIGRKKDVLKTIKSQLKTLQKELAEKEDVRKVKAIVKMVNTNTQADQQLATLQDNIRNINHQFFTALSNKYPNLTQTDKQICGFIRLGLLNKDIANLRNVSYKAARMSRYRIRKKLGLTDDQDLVEFLKGID